MSSQTNQTTPYPKVVDLSGEEIQFRLMTVDDAARLHDFFLALPASDLLFLQRDVTDGREIDGWMEEIARGETVTILAETEGTILGETTIRHHRVPWARHVGSVRVITDSAQRGRGLGRLLLQEMVDLAAERGVEKILAEMTVEQAPAQRLFEQLGFREEARFRAYVKDRQGNPHDLVVMTFDRPALANAARPAPATPVPWRCHACGHVTPAAEQPARCPDCGAAGEVMTVVEATPSE